MYALYRSGIEIYGVGETPDDARHDAEAFLGFQAINSSGEELHISTFSILSKVKVLEQPDEEEAHGQFYIRKCTQELATAVQNGPYDFKMDATGVLFLDKKDG